MQATASQQLADRHVPPAKGIDVSTAFVVRDRRP